jgi:hypothetical protein
VATDSTCGIAVQVLIFCVVPVPPPDGKYAVEDESRPRN